MTEEFIAGRNSILEALQSGRSINRVFVAKGERQGSVIQIVALAKEKGLVVQEVDKAKLDAMSGGIRHQGAVASVAPVEYAELEDILACASEQGEHSFLVLLDELEDPHNVGAILRTADAAGVHGVLMPKRRSCPLSGAVAKTSAGAVEYVPVARIGNVVQTIKQLQKQGFWVVGADMSGEKDYFDADLSGPIVVVVGSEGQGLGRLVKESCDLLVRIPMLGKISSLNASVACSLMLYEVMRQRRVKAK
ncbi:RNA methyltransferase [Anaerosporomusa subterranea]|jgi:23S rRNA (guanosine2251-2'-O)-methyltransferase|uniref:RNA methyltransferase n=1 Tax=Anaerosporomusa subterranea TaxID=1794912 RepID=A0A154BVD2_ANASB|nr:23S rRNA (guanosine(2251)-2'-O)-methyltransferase RlmB [Anaerosporomusa subterranea]KYZ77901.1 RNA methyltransferase [Anaerosporomusa subterranea]MDF2499971.1 methyltransferase, TrmH family, group 3 [Anaerosporomusa subterranea]